MCIYYLWSTSGPSKSYTDPIYYLPSDYVGDLPGELHEYVVFTVAIMAISKEQEAARALISFVTSQEAAPLLQKAMMEPASR